MLNYITVLPESQDLFFYKIAKIVNSRKKKNGFYKKDNKFC